MAFGTAFGTDKVRNQTHGMTKIWNKNKNFMIKSTQYFIWRPQKKIPSSRRKKIQLFKTFNFQLFFLLGLEAILIFLDPNPQHWISIQKKIQLSKTLNFQLFFLLGLEAILIFLDPNPQPWLSVHYS
jgi:hypothetical protein